MAIFDKKYCKIVKGQGKYDNGDASVEAGRPNPSTGGIGVEPCIGCTQRRVGSAVAPPLLRPASLSSGPLVSSSPQLLPSTPRLLKKQYIGNLLAAPPSPPRPASSRTGSLACRCTSPFHASGSSSNAASVSALPLDLPYRAPPLHRVGIGFVA